MLLSKQVADFCVARFEALTSSLIGRGCSEPILDLWHKSPIVVPFLATSSRFSRQWFEAIKEVETAVAQGLLPEEDRPKACYHQRVGLLACASRFGFSYCVRRDFLEVGSYANSVHKSLSDRAGAGPQFKSASSANNNCVWDAFARCHKARTGETLKVPDMKAAASVALSGFVDLHYPDAGREQLKDALNAQLVSRPGTLEELAGIDMLALLVHCYGGVLAVVSNSPSFGQSVFILGEYDSLMGPVPKQAIEIKNHHAHYCLDWTIPKDQEYVAYPMCLHSVIDEEKVDEFEKVTQDFHEFMQTEQEDWDAEVEASQPRVSGAFNGDSSQVRARYERARKMRLGVHSLNPPEIPSTGLPNRLVNGSADSLSDLDGSSKSDEEDMVTMLIGVIQNIVSEKLHGMSAATKVVMRLVPHVGIIVVGIFNLIKLYQADALTPTVWIMNVLQMASVLTAIYVTIVDNLNYSLAFDSILQLTKKALGFQQFCASEKPQKTPYGLAVKGGSLIIIVACMALGVPNTSLRNGLLALSTAGLIGSYYEDIVAVVGKACGLGDSEEAELERMMSDKIDQADEYLSTPVAGWSGPLFQRIEDFCHNTRQFLITLKEKCNGPQKTSLLKLVTTIEERMRGVREDRASRGRKVVPVGLYLWSQQGGIGKTEFANYLPKLISSKVKGFNEHIYRKDAASVHWPTQYGEHTLHYDEVGASKQQAGTSPFYHLNEIVSAQCGHFPGAHLEAKHQTLTPLLVIMTANKPLDQQDTGLSDHAREAMMSRMMCFEVQDKKFSLGPGKTRNTGQTHRKPDYTHLTFVDVLNKQHTVADVADYVCKQLATNLENFKAIAAVSTKGAQKYLHNGSPLDLADWNLCASESGKYCHFLAGKPGTRKTVDSIPIFIAAAELFKMEVYHPLDLELSEARSVANGSLVVIDDLCDMSSRAGQQRLLAYYNALPNNCKILVISNHGPKLSAWDRRNWSFTKSPSQLYQPVEILEPGLHRRCGFSGDKREGRFIVRTLESQWDYSTGEVIDVPSIIHDWYCKDAGVMFPQQLDSPPENLGFTSSEADIWLECPSGASQETIVRSCLANASFRLKKLFADCNFMSIDISNIAGLVRNLNNVAIAKDIHLRVWLNCGGIAYYINGKHYYVGSASACSHWVDRQAGVLMFPDGIERLLEQSVVDSVFLNTPYDGQDPAIFHWMTMERTRGTSLWSDILNRFPVSPEVLEKSMKAHKVGLFTRFCDWVKKHPILSAIIAAVVIAVPFLVKKLWHTSKEHEAGTCDKCSLDGDHIIWSKDCLNAPINEDTFCGKKGGKQKRFSGYIAVNGRTRKVSEEEDDDILGRAHHEARRLERATGYLDDEYNGEFRVGSVLYKHGYKTDQSGTIHRYLKIDQDDVMCGRSSTLPYNEVRVVNMDTGMALHGVMINQIVVRFNYHLICENPKAKLEVRHNGKAYSAEVVMCFPTADSVYAIIQCNGKATPVPGMKDISDKLIPTSMLPKVKNVIVTDPETKSQHHCLPFRYSTCKSPAMMPDGTFMTDRVGICAMGTVHIGFLKPGGCGSMITWYDGQHEWLVGAFSSYSISQKQYCFSPTTREEWNQVAARVETVYCSAQDESIMPLIGNPVTFFLSNRTKSQGSRTVTTPPKFCDKIQPLGTDPPSDVNVQKGCYTTVGTYNQVVPIDQKCRKQLVKNGLFQPLFGNVKKPVPNKNQIEAEFAALIPPDEHGRLHAENVRLSKARENIDGAQHPSAPIANAMEVKARELGLYWRCQMPLHNLAPLSIEDAIWGNSAVQAMDLDTSTGSAFCMLFPGIAKKSQVFGLRGEFLGEAGVWTKRAIEEQWEGWKNGVEFMIPSSFSLKAETLADDKLHKKRIVNVSDVVSVVNMRRLLYPLQKAFAAMGKDSPFQLEMDPLADTHQLAVKMGRFDLHYDLDASSFDLTLPSNLIKAAGKFCEGVYAAGPVLVTMLKTCFATICNTPVICGKSFMTKEGGIGSGIFGTSLIDSICSALIAYFAWQEKRCVGWSGAPESYYNHNWTYSTGDDTTLSVMCNDGGLKGDEVVAFAKDRLRMNFTDSQKTDGTVAPKRLEDMSYAGRQFVKLPRALGLWTGRLRSSALSGALCWSQLVDDVELAPMIASLAPEIALYGEEKYNHFLVLYAAAFPGKHMPRYEAVLRDLRERIVASNAGFLNKEFDIEYSQVSLQEFEIPPVKKINLVHLTKVAKNPGSMDHLKAASNPKSMAREVRRILAMDTEKWLNYEAVKRFFSSHFEYKLTVLAQGMPIPVPVLNGPGYLRDLLMAASGRDVDWVIGYAAHEPLEGAGKKRQIVRDYCNVCRLALNAREGGQAMERFVRILMDDQWESPAIGAAVLCSKLDIGNVPARDREPVELDPPPMPVQGGGAEEQEWVYVWKPKTGNAKWVFCSEKLATPNTAAPPMVEPTSGGSTSATVEVNPVGANANPLPGVATNDVELVHATTGAAKAPEVLSPAGMVGPEIQHQTSAGMNLLTLTGTKIFKRIVTISTGIGQGVKVFELDVNPWNEGILNPHQKSWADLHQRFYGPMEVYIQVVSAATIIGNLKFAYVPAVYADKIAVDQTTLDAFNPLEIACNVNGEGKIVMTPTATEYALTGIYRDSKQETFGKLYCITATNIENAYAQSVGVQIKLAFCLGEGAYYDLPVTLNSGGENPGSLDYSLDLPADRLSILAPDGDLADPVEYMGGVKGDLRVTTGLTASTIEGTPNWTASGDDAHIRCFAGANTVINWQHEAGDPAVPPNVAQYKSTDSGAVYDSSASNSAKVKPDAGINKWFESTYSTTPGSLDNAVSYKGLTLKSETTLYGCYYNDNDQYTPDPNVTFRATVVTQQYPIHAALGTQLLRDGSRFATDNSMLITGNLVPSAIAAVDNHVRYYPGMLGRTTRWKIEGAPICSKAANIGESVPASYHAMKLCDAESMVPAVIASRGHTIMPSANHVTAMMRAIGHMARSSPTKSIITELITADGVIVARVLRNAKGMFTPSAGIPAYSRLNQTISALQQRHIESSVEFPSLPANLASVFTDRDVSGQVYTGFIAGVKKRGVLDLDELKALNDAAQEPDHVFCMAAAAIGAVGGLLGGIGNIVNGQTAQATARDIANANNAAAWNRAQLQAQTATRIQFADMANKRAIAFAKLQDQALRAVPPLGRTN